MPEVEKTALSRAEPTVSVVMAVRDGERYVADAVASVLGQTLTDLELIVVDDGSTDATPRIVDGIRDPRIVRLRNPEPLRAAASWNRGIGAARGRFVAIQDADDIAEPGRLAAQAAALDADPSVGVCAGGYVHIDADGREIPGVPPAVTSEILVAWGLLLFTNPVCHSSVTMRRDLLGQIGGYDANLATSGDRYVLSRLLRVTRIRVLPQTVVRYRQHAGSVGARQKPLQRANSLRIRKDLLRWFLGDPPGADVDAIDAWYDAPIAESRIAPMTALILRTWQVLATRVPCTSAEQAALRDDVVARIESIRRRDGRIPRDQALRAGIGGLLGRGRRSE